MGLLGRREEEKSVFDAYFLGLQPHSRQSSPRVNELRIRASSRCELVHSHRSLTWHHTVLNAFWGFTFISYARTHVTGGETETRGVSDTVVGASSRSPLHVRCLQRDGAE